MCWHDFNSQCSAAVSTLVGCWHQHLLLACLGSGFFLLGSGYLGSGYLAIWLSGLAIWLRLSEVRSGPGPAQFFRTWPWPSRAGPQSVWPWPWPSADPGQGQSGSGLVWVRASPGQGQSGSGPGPIEIFINNFVILYFDLTPIGPFSRA